MLNYDEKSAEGNTFLRRLSLSAVSALVLILIVVLILAVILVVILVLIVVLILVSVLVVIHNELLRNLFCGCTALLVYPKS